MGDSAAAPPLPRAGREPQVPPTPQRLRRTPSPLQPTVAVRPTPTACLPSRTRNPRPVSKETETRAVMATALSGGRPPSSYCRRAIAEREGTEGLKSP